MKQISWEPVKGLAWFLAIYALVRLILSTPSMGQQNFDVFAIALGALCLTWLVYTSQKSSLELMLLAVSLFSVASFFSWRWGYFDLLEIKIIAITLGGISFLIFIFLFIKAILNKRKPYWPVAIRLMVLWAFMFGLEFLLPYLYQLEF